MLLALPCSLVTGQHGLHRGFVFLSCWVDLAQDEREAEEETATFPDTCSQPCRHWLGSSACSWATRATRGPDRKGRGSFWSLEGHLALEVGVVSSHHWVS